MCGKDLCVSMSLYMGENIFMRWYVSKTKKQSAKEYCNCSINTSK